MPNRFINQLLGPLRQATEDSVVWQLDRETFSHIVRDASAKRREAFQDFLKLGEEKSREAHHLQLSTTSENCGLWALICIYVMIMNASSWGKFDVNMMRCHDTATGKSNIAPST